jgi:Tfp pilus assembly protein PilN
MYKINLLPNELQRDLSIDIRGLVRRVTVTVTILLLLASYGVFLFMGYLTQKEINETQKYLNQISAAVKKVEGIKAQRVKNEESTKKFKELLNARQTRFPLLEDLSYNMPVDLWLENVDMSYVAPAKAATGTAQTQPAAQNQAQGQAAADKKAPVSPPAPNTLII